VVAGAAGGRRCPGPGRLTGRGPDTPAYAALARVADPAALPPAYNEVTQLDMFRDEDLAYALRLGHAGVPVEFHLHPAPRTNSTSSPSTPPPPGAPSETAFFRAPDAPLRHRWLPCSQP